MWTLARLERVRPAHWITAAAVILFVDYATGPPIRFALLFALPVAMATAAHGKPVGAAVALLLPLAHLAFFLRWGLPTTWPLEAADTGIDAAILLGFVALLDRVIRQRRELRVLRGMLPICGFCKRIRDEGGRWHQLESFIHNHSEAQFSHTFCPDCGRRHYPDLVD